jgi:hypothetical protein
VEGPASAQLRQRGDLRVRLIRRNNKLEAVARQRRDQLVRHGRRHINALREVERGAIAVARVQSILPLALGRRAALPPVSLLVAVY